MTLDDLYEEIKHVLKYLDLNWDEKDKVSMIVKDNVITFSYAGRSISITYAKSLT